MTRWAALTAMVLVCCVPYGVASPAAAQQQEVAQSVYAKVAPSVLLIVVEDAAGKPISQGSGFVIGSNSVVTNAHVVRGGFAFVHTGVAKVPCTVTRIDEAVDLAVLQPSVALTAPALQAAPENTLIGTRVFALGNPHGLERTITEGLYTGPRTIQGRRLLQISAPISPGSSGGPVVDSNGFVVGVAVSSIESGQNLNFAVPVDTLIALLARPATGQAPAPPPAPPPAPRPAASAPPASVSAAVLTQLQAFDAIVKQRLAMGLTTETEQRWFDLRKRERDLLAAAVNASNTDADLRATFYAAVAEHSDMGLDVARMALKRRTAAEWWHYTGIAASALMSTDYAPEPLKTELLNEAKAAVLEGLQLNGASWVWLLAGQIHDALREWGSAKAAFNLAMTLGAEPLDRPVILRGQWRSASALNEMADADRLWAEYLKTGAASDQDHHDRANHIASMGRFSEGARIMGALAQKPQQQTSDPTYSLWYWVTYAHWKAAEDKAALNAAAETMRSAPDQPAARRTAAMAATIAASIQIAQGDYTGAAESIGFAITADPTFSSAYSQLAKIHLASQRFVEAEREARKAISLAAADTDAEAYYVLGQALGAQRQWIPAAEALLEAARIDAANPYPAFNAAISFENAGRIPDAIRWYEEALRRDPNMKERDQIRAVIARLKTPRLS